ncbi:SYF2 splicing factor family protein [Cryptosporidium meleagridis]|uniref:Pre-mRNA-splicing factor SYF2 n=1 Tax=Cryptosporidium meleagridis TaxID=93969 RepID=A0A2P4Z5M5_9CRYT|nr:SYF2 splicing factor family protein [Cryptosporidium meleagridis]
MITEKKVISSRHSLEFLFRNEDGIQNNERKEKLNSLNTKVHSAMILNMEIFRNERRKELDKLSKLSNEEFIESSALRTTKNNSKVEYTCDIRFESTELWRIQRSSQKFENTMDNNRIKTKNRKRGLISSTNKKIIFDRENYEQQINELKANPEKFEFLRTSHVPSDNDKNLLINQYIKNQRKKVISESTSIRPDIYHINQENKKYNEKLDRAFHEYSSEIKQNLERGTAL